MHFDGSLHIIGRIKITFIARVSFIKAFKNLIKARVSYKSHIFLEFDIRFAIPVKPALFLSLTRKFWMWVVKPDWVAKRGHGTKKVENPCSNHTLVTLGTHKDEIGC